MVIIPRRGGRHYNLVKTAEQAMLEFRIEIARDLGLEDKIDEDGGFGNFTTKEVGSIGGEMTRRIMALGQYMIQQRHEAGEARLLPEDMLPEQRSVRSTTNSGNPTLHATHNIPESTQHSGQQFH